MPKGYDVVEVAKGARVWVCDRCACVTTRPTEHDAWHVDRQVQTADAMSRLRDLERAPR